MIRQPSSEAQLYAWHRDALRDPDTPRSEGCPECGWYKRRIVTGGPWVPVKVTVNREVDPDTGELTGPEKLVALYDDRTVDASTIWTHLTPISREEFQALRQRQIDLPIMQGTHAKLDLTEEPIRP